MKIYVLVVTDSNLKDYTEFTEVEAYKNEDGAMHALKGNFDDTVSALNEEGVRINLKYINEYEADVETDTNHWRWEIHEATLA